MERQGRNQSERTVSDGEGAGRPSVRGAGVMDSDSTGSSVIGAGWGHGVHH